jgi:hypothetical protein
MSGDAFTNTQDCKLLPLTAIEDCVRARVRRVPARKPAQFGQLQFHWGKPPPAADPSTRIFTLRWMRLPAGLSARWAHHRLAMYMVISMPNRKSIAVGVSHFIMHLLEVVPRSSTTGCFAESTAS